MIKPYYTFKDLTDPFIARLVAIEERNRFEDYALEEDLIDHVAKMEREEAQALEDWYFNRLNDDWLLQHADPATDPIAWRN